MSASDEGLIASYTVTRSIYKTATTFRMPSREVYARLRARGVIEPDEKFERPARTFELSTKDLLIPKDKAAAWLVALQNEPGTVKQIAKRHNVSQKKMCRIVAHHYPREYEIIAERKNVRSTAIARGKRVEDAIRKDLREKGWGHIHRSHRSLGAVDLYAFRPGAVWFIQCKASLEIGIDEWNGLVELAIAAGAIPILAGRKDGELVYYRIQARRLHREDWPMIKVSPL